MLHAHLPLVQEEMVLLLAHSHQFVPQFATRIGGHGLLQRPGLHAAVVRLLLPGALRLRYGLVWLIAIRRMRDNGMHPVAASQLFVTPIQSFRPPPQKNPKPPPSY